MTRRLLHPRGLAATVGIGVALTATSFALAADGTPDTTFGGDGVVELTPYNAGGWYESDPVSTIDAQGRTLVAQVANRGEGGTVAVWRVLPDGTIDPSFNEGESTNLSIRYPDQNGVQDIRVVGDTIFVVVSNRDDDFVLYRLEADGTEDPAIHDEEWYGDGATVLGAPSGNRDCATVAADIGATGAVRTYFSCVDRPTQYRAARSRYVVVKTFSALGVATGETEVPSPVAGAWVTGAATDDAGHDRILFNSLAGFAVVDRSGEELASVEGTADAITVDEGGAFAVAGAESDGVWALRAFTADGTARPGFGEEGTAIVEDDELGARDTYYDGWSDDPLWARNGVSHVRSTPDGGLLAVGAEHDPSRERSTPDGDGSATVRVTASGDVDPAWGPNGVKVLAYGGAEPLDLRLAGPPVFDAAKRTSIPVAVPTYDNRGTARGTATRVEQSVRVFRLGDAPAQQQNQQQTTQTQTQQQAAPPAPTPVKTTAPSTRAPRTAKTCLSRRSFTIRLRPRQLKTASVTVAGKKVAVKRRGGRLTARVNLRKLEQATFTVKVSGRTAKGRSIRETRTYRTCRVGENGPKVKGGSITITLGS